MLRYFSCFCEFRRILRIYLNLLTILSAPVIVKYMEENLDITNPRDKKQNFFQSVGPLLYCGSVFFFSG